MFLQCESRFENGYILRLRWHTKAIPTGTRLCGTGEDQAEKENPQMNFNANQIGARRPIRAAACLLCGALLCGMLTGCRSSRPQDGTYTARYQYPSHGNVE